MAERSIYPKSECAGVSCNRRTGVYPPGTIWICGRCYRKGPKWLRDRRKALGRKLAHVRDPKRRERIERLRGDLVGRIIDAVNQPPTADEMSPAVIEELRALGLL